MYALTLLFLSKFLRNTQIA